MKITKLFPPKKYIYKQLENKKIKTIQEYTTISESLEPKAKKQIRENIYLIARYAKRKDCHLEFVPAEDLFQNSMQINVYKKAICILKSNDGSPLFDLNFKKLSGKSILPQNAIGSDLVNNIRKAVKNILANNKN